MRVTELATYLEFARELAEIGGRVAMGHYRHDPETKRKDDGSWVTEADWKAEAQIRVRIARTYPDHNVLGEEEGLTAAGGGRAHEGAPTWVVDPIDETHNYMAGIPIWATLVGLRVDGQSVVGAAHAPALGETYDGAIGLGARMNGAEISVDPIADMSTATVLFADAGSFRVAGFDEFFDRLVHRAWRTRGFGGFWGHLLVARGAAHVMVEPQLRVWDVVALEPIVSEAGGRLTQIDGAPFLDLGSALTTCGTLHDEVVRLSAGTSFNGISPIVRVSPSGMT
jgi:histidinol-phosphatase